MPKKSKTRRKVPVKVKASVKRMNRAQLAALLVFIQMLIRMSTPVNRKRKGKSSRKGKKMSPALKRFLKKHKRFPHKGELR